jgi:glutamate-1-semialdehyde 2,1-aminomutase
LDLELQAKQERFIAQGCLTNSKHISAFVKGIYPTHLYQARGAFVLADDNKRYFDTICALGTISLGYANAAVDFAVQNTLQNEGVSFSLPSRHESFAAEYLLTEFLPKYDAVKYLKTGAEATSASVRIARSATGRKWILSVGYHGFHDLWISTKQNPQGLAERFYIHEYESLEELLERKNKIEGPFLLDDVAAVIIEPIMLEHSEANTQKLLELKKWCERHQILLIFDEIVCGARIPEFAIASVIDPDLVCLGKGIANGFPLSCVVGKKHLMQETPYFVSSTFAGEILSLVAHHETMKQLRIASLKELYRMASETMKWVSEKSEMFHVKLEGYGTRGFWKGKIEDIALVFQELCRAQVLVGRSYFYNFASKDQDAVLRSRMEDAFFKLSRGATLEGECPREPFKRV